MHESVEALFRRPRNVINTRPAHKYDQSHFAVEGYDNLVTC